MIVILFIVIKISAETYNEYKAAEYSKNDTSDKVYRGFHFDVNKWNKGW